MILFVSRLMNVIW